MEDIQNVTEQEFERKLTAKELQLVEGKIGDHINWYEAILNTMYASNIKPKTQKNGVRLKKAKDKKKNS